MGQKLVAPRMLSLHFVSREHGPTAFQILWVSHSLLLLPSISTVLSWDIRTRY